jgi:hypothetical protein
LSAAARCEGERREEKKGRSQAEKCPAVNHALGRIPGGRDLFRTHKCNNQANIVVSSPATTPSPVLKTLGPI